MVIRKIQIRATKIKQGGIRQGVNFRVKKNKEWKF